MIALLGLGLLGAKVVRVVPMSQKLEKNQYGIVLDSVQWGFPETQGDLSRENFEDTTGFLGQLGESVIHQRKYIICKKKLQVESF